MKNKTVKNNIPIKSLKRRTLKNREKKTEGGKRFFERIQDVGKSIGKHLPSLSKSSTTLFSDF